MCSTKEKRVHVIGLVVIGHANINVDQRGKFAADGDHLPCLLKILASGPPPPTDTSIYFDNVCSHRLASQHVTSSELHGACSSKTLAHPSPSRVGKQRAAKLARCT